MKTRSACVIVCATALLATLLCPVPAIARPSGTLFQAPYQDTWAGDWSCAETSEDEHEAALIDAATGQIVLDMGTDSFLGSYDCQEAGAGADFSHEVRGRKPLTIITTFDLVSASIKPDPTDPTGGNQPRSDARLRSFAVTQDGTYLSGAEETVVSYGGDAPESTSARTVVISYTLDGLTPGQEVLIIAGAEGWLTSNWGTSTLDLEARLVSVEVR